MGGTKNPIVNTAPALVWICGECHNWIESYRDKARGDGWLVRRGFDPAGQSLITTTDSLIMLTADGGVVPASLAGINEGPTPW
jgi:5-methylcytosine-specific restriction protein A